MKKIKPLSRLFLSMVLTVITCLYLTPVQAQIHPGLDSERCMADAYGGSLNCTANDVEITQVNPIDADGDPAYLPDGSYNSCDDNDPGCDPDDPKWYNPVQCVLGETFALTANVTIRTNANERYDTTFYLPLTEQSPMDIQEDLGGDTTAEYPWYCSLILPDVSLDPTKPAWVDLEDDVCGDITKANELSVDEYTLEAITVTMLCADEDGNSEADFNYCAAWDNKVDDNCIATPSVDENSPYPGQIPGTKSKCNCDRFNIPVFIKPLPPIITKTVTPLTGNEPYHDFLYTIEIKPGTETKNSIFIRGLYDIVSSSTNPDGAGPYTFNLNDKVNSTNSFWTLLADDPDTTCDNLDLSGDGLEITPTSLGVTCDFKIRIADENLPDGYGDPQTFDPELFQDFVRVEAYDENGAPVGDNTCSSAGTGNCTNETEVSLTNVAPSIEVTKTVDTDLGTAGNQDQVTEGTHTVEYTVLIENTSEVDAVEITAITDSVNGGAAVPLSGDGDCQVGTILPIGASCDFTYEAEVTGNTGDVTTNTVWAYVVDNENDTASNSDEAIVTFTNSPGAIDIVKTVKGVEDGATENVTESGEYVTFHVWIKNTSLVDTITLDDLSDDKFGDLFADSTAENAADYCSNLDGVALAAGETKTCEFVRFLDGEPGPGNVHTDWATVHGNTGDYIPCGGSMCLETVQDTDDAKVAFINEPPNITFDADMSATLFVTISNGSTYEPVYLQSMTIGGVNVEDGEGVTDNFIIHNTGGTFGGTSFPACTEDLYTAAVEIAPEGTYTCAFTVELTDSSSSGLFKIASGQDLAISVVDDDGGTPVEPSINVKAQLTPGL